MNEKPNLFSYATSELSQDAFICWLLSWADPKYKNSDSDSDKELHKCAVNLIEEFFNLHGKKLPVIETIKIQQQEEKIDVLCNINEKEYAILIEDKTNTRDHDNQLEIYFDKVKKMGFREGIIPIYFKTGDQANYDDVRSKGYKPFLRKDFLKILNNYNGNNIILTNYRDFLQSIQNKVDSYSSLKLIEWTWDSFIGYFIELQKYLNNSGWDYVPNPSGGFHGFWWHSLDNINYELYLQLEHNPDNNHHKLCFKISVKDKKENSFFRNQLHSKLMENYHKYDLKLRKPKRFGNGKYMTVCVYDGNYRVNSNGIINIKKTVERLKQAEYLLDFVRKQ